MPSPLGCPKKPADISAPAVIAQALTNDNDDDGPLPKDVLYEVLLRLPVKELCRLRVVCRSWRSLTSDPGFARSHASRHLPLVAGIWNNREVHILEMTTCSSNKIVRRLPVPQHVYDLSIALHGLLCVSPIYACHSYVLDPSVAGEVAVVATLPDSSGDDVDLQQDGSSPSVPGLVPNRASFRFSSPTVLGHVPSTGEYKALRTNDYCTGWDGGMFGQERITETCLIITVSGAGAGAGGGAMRWRARPCPPVGGGPSCLRDRVVVDGVAYFLRRPSYDSYHDRKYSKDIEPDVIFAFDLATEEWRPNTIRGPLSSNSDSELKFSRKRDNLQLCVLDGCLVMAHHKNRDCSMDLWFLEDMDKGLWNKRYSIRCVAGCKDRHWSRPPCPLHVLEDGRIVMWGAKQERVLVLYDPRTNTSAKLGSMEEYHGTVTMNLGSLLCSGLRQS